MEEGKNGFGLYDNEILITLDSSGRSDHVNKAIKYYCVNFESGDDRNNYNFLSLKQKFKNRERKLIAGGMLNSGEYDYYYNGDLIKINVKVYRDKPLASEGWTGFHEEIDLKIVKNDKTKK